MYNIYYQNKRNDFYPMDQNGFLNPPIQTIDETSELNRLILNAIKTECRQFLRSDLVSIFFRGSQLIDSYKSDFDIVVIVRTGSNINSKDLTNRLDQKLRRNFFHISSFDSVVISLSELETSRKLQFILKVLSIRVYGEPLELKISGFRPSRELIFNLPNVEEKFSIINDLLINQKSSDTKKIINYFVKYLMRAAYELVLEREMKFTRDIPICQDVFSKYYPHYKDISLDIMQYYNLNNVNVKEFVKDSKKFCSILLNELEKINDKHEQYQHPNN